MFSAHGTVVKGKGEGRKLGYPTANLEYAMEEKLEHGVWLCEADVDGELKHGLAVIGMWKLPNGLPSLEVHLLDFDQDLYGKALSVSLPGKLRDLQPFTDSKQLVAQIKEDIADARAAFDARIS
jgi:riboflavin kinase/FMN adenylyltransferase